MGGYLLDVRPVHAFRLYRHRVRVLWLKVDRGKVSSRISAGEISDQIAKPAWIPALKTIRVLRFQNHFAEVMFPAN